MTCFPPTSACGRTSNDPHRPNCKKQRGERPAPAAPLLCAQSGQRLSKRRVQFAWRQWQEQARFDRMYPFHALRHSSVTNVYRATRDLFLAQPGLWPYRPRRALAF